MRILITNDDGAGAAQLVPLILWCRKLGDVTVVVPKQEQSAKSHSIEIHKPFEAKQVELAPGVTVWAVDSTPADCVRFACSGLGLTFDVVISGHVVGDNYDAEIAEMERVCKPGGVILDIPGDQHKDSVLKQEMIDHGFEPLPYVGSFGAKVIRYRKVVNE